MKGHMKTIETKLYSFKELSSDAQNRVIERIAENISNDPYDFTLNECMDSLNAVVSACGLRLQNWSIGPYNRNNFARVDCDDEGNRAKARFLRVLIEHRYPRPARFTDMKFEGVCGFTGVCFDDDVCEAIWEALMDGETLGKAFDRAADRIMRLCEDDLEYRTSKEGILENLDNSEEIYTEEGDTL